MDQNLIFTIAGFAALLLIVLVFLFSRRKKKKKRLQSSQKQVAVQEVTASKYNGRKADEEELEGAAKLDLVNFEDGLNALVLRFEIKGGTIKLDDIEPYDNDWGFVHNFSEIVGQKRHRGQQLRLFFNRKKRKRTDKPEAFYINIVYRDQSGVQWLQPLRYHSSKGVKVKDVQILGESAPE